MNTVSGSIVVAENGQGIANVLVEIFDVNAQFKPGETRRAAVSMDQRRLGSAITDSQGAFKLGYGGAAQKPDRRAVNLFLTVSAPDDPARPSAPLFVAQTVRRNAGQSESYLVRIPEADLEKAGIPHPAIAPGNAEPPASVRKRLLASAEREAAVLVGERDALKVKVAQAKKLTETFHTEFRPALESRLSGVTPTQAASDTYVKPGASVADAHKKVVATDLRAVISAGGKRAPVRTLVALTAEQVDLVRGKLDGDRKIKDEDLNAILQGERPAPTEPFYSRRSPVELICRKVSQHEKDCLGDLMDPPPSPEPAPEDAPVDTPGTGVERIESSDVPQFLARLVDTMTSPEEGVLTGLEPRATRGTVASGVQELSFKPSPADTSAFYDFHNLQVAFRHVWQEAINEGILNVAEDAYNEIVLAGGQPKPGVIVDPVHNLRREATAVNHAMRGNGQENGAAAGPLGRPGIARVSGGWLSSALGMTSGLYSSPAVYQAAATSAEPLPALLAELEQCLQQPYAFTTFAANRKERSVNFGTLITYRQEWKPTRYQAGRMAKTVTVAPKETQRYTKTIKRHRKRAEKEVRNHLRIHKEETASTSRLEEEIVRKANAKTNFQLSSEATAKDPSGMASGTTKTSFEREASQTSESVKKAFHESVAKASQETKDEITIEVSTEESEDVELTESGEITNPNDELAVTFLFYELQRCYQVSERIQAIRPVVLVAQEMPQPHEINEAWLITHDWILRRALLDDSFAPALSYLSEGIVGDRVALEEMRTNIAQQRQLIEQLKQELTVVRSRLATYRNLMERSVLQPAAKKKGGGSWLSAVPLVGGAVALAEDAIEAVGEFIHPDAPDVGASRQDTLKDAMQRTADEERDLLMRVEREVTALNALTESYAKALAQHYNQRAQVLRLQNHVMQNITYYMQAIWNYEPPDQRYLRLHEDPVPTFRTKRSFRFDELVPVNGKMADYAHRRLGLDLLPPTSVFDAEVLPEFQVMETKPLAQVADLDNLLGYFGNYMIFALKESNPLTDFMMQPYVLQGFNELIDPDELGNWTLDEFVDYVCCLRKRLSETEFEEIRDHLREQYDKLIKAPHRNGEEIIVPTGSLFIEALPSTNSLMERFKTIHRAIDVKKVQAEVRHAELENLRLVDRILHGEREDPDIEKKIIVEGSTPPVLPVDDE